MPLATVEIVAEYVGPPTATTLIGCHDMRGARAGMSKKGKEPPTPGEVVTEGGTATEVETATPGEVVALEDEDKQGEEDEEEL